MTAASRPAIDPGGALMSATTTSGVKDWPAIARSDTLCGLARALEPMARIRPPMVTIRTPDREQLREAAAARGMTVADLIRQALAAQGVPIRCS